jgi:predicted transcriptional regulator/DNA-binding XRE family transcriptional regulator
MYLDRIIIVVDLIREISGGERLKRRKVKTKPAVFEGHSDNLGGRLRSLRSARGATQASLAERLGVGQTALSRLERRGDLLLSTVDAYVEALGGRAHVAATFPGVEPVFLSGDSTWRPVPNDDSVGLERPKDDQLWLPNILCPDRPSPSRDVILSIHPAHAEKILDGTKTVELRRRFTDGVAPGTLALIYTTSPTRALTGFAKIDKVQRLAVRDIWERYRVAARLRKSDFDAYFCGLDRGYVIVFSSARPFARPVGLSELRKRFSFEPPQSYQYAPAHMRELMEHDRPQDPY